VPVNRPSLAQLKDQAAQLDEAADFHTDLYTLFESRLLESRLATLTIPSEMPLDTPHTSGFGFRNDPFTGRQALHTGLDFPAEPGTVIRAAAAGIVLNRGSHATYGEMIEIDHGNDVITRYAHCSSIDVPVGALVRRGQAIAKVGNTGRSTGPHLHFEVLVRGVHHDPVRFLAGAARAAVPEFATRPQPLR
jgi:murein DD-endopeptidase MepM/ murein hydrolase activator NlpD